MLATLALGLSFHLADAPGAYHACVTVVPMCVTSRLLARMIVGTFARCQKGSSVFPRPPSTASAGASPELVSAVLANQAGRINGEKQQDAQPAQLSGQVEQQLHEPNTKSYL